jgi:hypothetical protein
MRSAEWEEHGEGQPAADDPDRDEASRSVLAEMTGGSRL